MTTFSLRLAWLALAVLFVAGCGDMGSSNDDASPGGDDGDDDYDGGEAEHVGGELGGDELPDAPAVDGYPFEVPVPELSRHDVVNVVATGFKASTVQGEIGQPLGACVVVTEVVGEGTDRVIRFRVWDSNGVEYDPNDMAWVDTEPRLQFIAIGR